MAKRKATTKKVGQEYWKQRERVLRRVREIEKRGYIVDRSIIPDLPDKISAKDVRELKEITPNIIYKHSDFVVASTGEILTGYQGRKLERQQAAYEGIIKQPVLDRKTAEKVRKAREFLENKPKNPKKKPDYTSDDIEEKPDKISDEEKDNTEEEPDRIADDQFEDYYKDNDEEPAPYEKTKQDYPRESDVVIDNLADDLGVSEEDLTKLEEMLYNEYEWGRSDRAKALHDFNNAKAGDILARAVQLLGREKVAKNIQDNADRVYELVNNIRARYKKSETTEALAEFQQILMGDTKDDEWFNAYQEANGDLDFNEY